MNSIFINPLKRKEFIVEYIVLSILALAILMDWLPFPPFVIIVLVIIVILGIINISIRRAMDMGMNKWYIMGYLIPIYQLVIFFRLLTTPSLGSNEPTPTFNSKATLIVLFILVLGIAIFIVYNLNSLKDAWS